MEHWTTGECLALFHAVLKFGENSWEDVSKAICKYSKELHRPLDVVEENSLSKDEIFFSPKRCAEKFAELLAEHSNNRELNAEETEKRDNTQPIVVIANKLREARMEELRKSIEARESNMKKLKEEMSEISSGTWDALLEAENKDTENDNSVAAVPTPTTSKEPTKPEAQSTELEPPNTELPSKKQKVEKPEEVQNTNVMQTAPTTQTTPAPIPPVQLPPATPKSPILPPPQPKEPVPMEVTTTIVEPEKKPEPAIPASPVYLPVEASMAESQAITHTDKEKEEEDLALKKKRKAAKQKTKKTPKDTSETSTPTPSSPATTPSSAAPPSPTFTAIKLEAEVPTVKEDMSPIVEVKKEKDKTGKHANKGDTVRTLLDTLKKISAHKYAHVFKQPVSLEEAPDYDEIIKQRMDLSTIKKNLIEGKITTTQEFWRDLLLMFQNAMIYNMKGSEIYNMAVKLKKFSAKEMEPIFAAEEKMRIALQQNQAPGKRTLRSSSSGIPSQKF